MFTTIFSGMPKGVTIRRLDTKRKAQNQERAYKFSAWKDNGQTVYGDSIKDVLSKLNTSLSTHIQ
jgi:hypothetical protein